MTKLEKLKVAYAAAEDAAAAAWDATVAADAAYGEACVESHTAQAAANAAWDAYRAELEEHEENSND
jgi:hypothetical protein